MLSSRINKIEESGIRKIFEIATKSCGDFVNLSIGQPHFPATDALKIAAKNAIENNFNAYMPTQGYIPLREKIVSKLKKENKIDADIDDVIITSGVSGGLFLLFSSVLDAGDEVILPDPYFVLYKQLLDFLGVKVVLLDTYPDFKLSSGKIERLVTDKTKMIIVNSPNNPTGMVYSKEELEGVVNVAREHDLLVMSDEIYEVFDYDKQFFSIGSIYAKTITLNGFSKSHSVTGWRIGYAHGPKEIIKAMNKLQMYTFVCAPSFAQVALAKEMNSGISSESYSKNRDLLVNSLRDKYELNIPEGAFYAYIKNPLSRGVPDKAGCVNFVEKLIENKLLVVPGNVFSSKDNYFRLSFAVDKKVLKKGIEILLELI